MEKGLIMVTSVTSMTVYLSVQKAKLKQPLRNFTDEQLRRMNLRYYSPEMHVASFTLPLHIREVRRFQGFYR